MCPGTLQAEIFAAGTRLATPRTYIQGKRWRQAMNIQTPRGGSRQPGVRHVSCVYRVEKGQFRLTSPKTAAYDKVVLSIDWSAYVMHLNVISDVLQTGMICRMDLQYWHQPTINFE